MLFVSNRTLGTYISRITCEFTVHQLRYLTSKLMSPMIYFSFQQTDRHYKCLSSFWSEYLKDDIFHIRRGRPQGSRITVMNLKSSKYIVQYLVYIIYPHTIRLEWLNCRILRTSQSYKSHSQTTVTSFWIFWLPFYHINVEKKLAFSKYLVP